MKDEFYQKLRENLRQDQILVEEPLANHTTFRIGGPSRFLLLPETKEQIAFAVKLCENENMPYYIIGNGSNLLVSDKGYSGTIIKLNKSFSSISITPSTEEGDKYLVHAQAGVLLSKLATTVAKAGLTGFEFAAGIPGTLGGAVTMNAGAYGGEIKDSIRSATVLDEDYNIFTLSREELELEYRSSIVQKKNYIVLEAEFVFESGDKDKIFEKIIDLNTRRHEKQPLEFPSAGSAFKRPKGYYAGKLIMDCDLRGFQIGGAQVSTKHCGFVINTGSATALDIRNLLLEIRRIVYEKYNVMLEPEVKMLGEF